MTLYSARDFGPLWLALALAQTSRLEVYRDGVLVAPASGTYTLTDPTGTVVVDAQAVTVSSDRATYALLATQLDNAALLGEGWEETWVLVLGGNTETFKRPAALTRSKLYPVIADADLTGEYSDLASLRPASETTFQRYIDASWKRIVGQLYNAGQWPYLIMDPWALRDAHLHRTLELIWRDYGSGGSASSNYLDLAREHGRLAWHAWRALSFRYDTDLSGRMDSATDSRSIDGPLYTSAPEQSVSWDF